MTTPSSDLETALVLMTFISQILVFSFWAPYREWRRVRMLEGRFPRDEFALAYRSTGQKSPGLRTAFVILNGLVGISGIGVLAFGLSASYGAEAMSQLMAYTLWAQLLVLFIDGLRGVAIRRELREAGVPAVRTAELRPRRIDDYISPSLTVTALLLWLVCAAICIYAVPKLTGPIFWLTLVLELVNVWMLVRMVARLRGALTFLHADAYMAPQDRQKVGQLQTGRLFRLSIFYSVLISLSLLGNTRLVHIDSTQLTIGLSLYFQVGLVCLSIWLRRFYENVDFTPYRADAAPRTRLAGARAD